MHCGESSLRKRVKVNGGKNEIRKKNKDIVFDWY